MAYNDIVLISLLRLFDINMMLNKPETICLKRIFMSC